MGESHRTRGREPDDSTFFLKLIDFHSEYLVKNKFRLNGYLLLIVRRFLRGYLRLPGL